MKWGDRLKDLEAIQKQGKTPAALENRPLLLPGLDFYLETYNRLGYDKPIGMTVGPIPTSSIIKWCELHGICDINEIEVCIRYIRKLEQIEYELKHKEAEK